MELKPHPGYANPFCSDEYPGAYPNGTRIYKRWSEVGEETPTNTRGKVLGSIGYETLGIGYWVEWDSLPGYAIFVMEKKVGKV